MSNTRHQLTELIRILEEQNYIFPVDPRQITANLRHSDGMVIDKLHQRAMFLDGNGRLQHSLMRVEAGRQWLKSALTILWFVLGFTGSVALMGQSGLNFFAVLSGILGMNTVMFGVWLWAFCFGRSRTIPFAETLLMRGKDIVNRALLRLFSEEWQQPNARWAAGALTHRLWAASLGGMLAAVILLLTVRQYTFNWESTLLSNNQFINIIQALGWLPSQFGFPVPSAEDIHASRLNSSVASARQWGGLLAGSILCYGFMPRLIAWFVCRTVHARIQTDLPLEKPYYQNLIRYWQNKIIDADTVQETIAKPLMPVHFDETAERWAITLEQKWQHADWFVHTAGQDWLDKGLLESRTQVSEMIDQLQQQTVLLLIGIPTRTVPDRGMLRQLVKLAQAAQGGAMVKLLSTNDANDYAEQWQKALIDLGIMVAP